jgi:hypothetical protein
MESAVWVLLFVATLWCFTLLTENLQRLFDKPKRRAGTCGTCGFCDVVQGTGHKGYCCYWPYEARETSPDDHASRTIVDLTWRGCEVSEARDD